jgi:hypothetical protein
MHTRRGNIYCDDNGCDIIRSSSRSYQRVVVSFIVVAVAAAATMRALEGEGQRNKDKDVGVYVD